MGRGWPSWPASSHCPVHIGRIEVHPGDLVLAYGSGVVFLAAAQAEEAIVGAEMIAAREGIEFRVLPRGLAQLHMAVVQSSLLFSGLRLRNAADAALLP